MTALRTLKKLLLGETWLLPAGVAAAVLLAGLVVKPSLPHAWVHAGGFVLLGAVLAVLVLSVARSARR